MEISILKILKKIVTNMEMRILKILKKLVTDLELRIFEVILAAFRSKTPQNFLLAPLALAVGLISYFGRGRAENRPIRYPVRLTLSNFLTFRTAACSIFFHFTIIVTHCELAHMYKQVFYSLDP